MRVLVFGFVIFALTACSVPGGHRPPGASGNAGDLADTQAKRNEVHLTLIRDMIRNGQYYAALAHIQAEQQVVGSGDIQLKLLEADTRRDLHQDAQAEKLYMSLLGTAVNGQALHGLGLLRARQGDQAQAIADLTKAAQELPTDVDIRNDLGYALMRAGEYRQAVPQLSTAAELAPHEMRSRNNLIILMYLMGDRQAAERLAQRSGLDSQALLRLQQDARNIQARQKPAAG